MIWKASLFSNISSEGLLGEGQKGISLQLITDSTYSVWNVAEAQRPRAPRISMTAASTDSYQDQGSVLQGWARRKLVLGTEWEVIESILVTPSWERPHRTFRIWRQIVQTVSCKQSGHWDLPVPGLSSHRTGPPIILGLRLPCISNKKNS